MSSLNIYTSPLCSCVNCRKEYSQKAIGTHFTAKHTNNYKRIHDKNTQKFQLRCSCIICNQEISVQNLEKHYNKHFTIKQTKICPKCGRNHQNNGIFCSRKCANSRQQTKESNEKRSNTLKGHIRLKSPQTKVSKCIVCNIWFPGTRKTCSSSCNKIHFQNIGKINAAKRNKRSKDEIALYELCDKYFLNVTHNEPIFNGWDADILIYDIKTAILWNGPWHYKEMGFSNHSLSQVQNRDLIKQKEIISAGWKYLVFEDRYFTPETAFNDIILRSTE